MHVDITAAPQPPAHAREKFAEHKAALGGNRKPIEFTSQQVATLEAAADELIPGGDGFPAPSEVNIVNYIARYVTPRGKDNTQFPNAHEDDFKAKVDGLLGQAFVDADASSRVATLKRIEVEQAEFFEQLRNLVYYGYYSRREVVRAINRNLPAGRDYHASPQPYGYWEVIEPWDESLLTDVVGDYIRTEDAKRVTVKAPGEASSVRSPSS
jgi:gluconate 2-dehydrogenase subunit 3-like protein